MAASNHQSTSLDLPSITCKWPNLLPFDTPNIANPSIKWRIGSSFVVPAVGLFSSFWMNIANSSTVHHAAILHEALNQNYLASRATRSWFMPSRATHLERRPLITYSNHACCLDDPLMWGALLPFRWQFNSDRHRWSCAAAELCFKNNWYSMFFSLGKTFPISRGEGIYQPAMNYASKLMQAGQWVHFFPEGKVNPKPENSDPDLLFIRLTETSRSVDLKRIQEAVKAAAATQTEGRKMFLTDLFFKSKISSSSDSLVANYALKWGLARLIIEHVLGEGSQHDEECCQFLENDPELSADSTSRLMFDEMVQSTVGVLPEVDILPIYHIGMDDVLPTRMPYVPKMSQKVTFLVRPEGPIRIDRVFLLKLFGEDTGALKVLSLTEKRIKLMQFLEDELYILRDKAQWLHDLH